MTENDLLDRRRVDAGVVLSRLRNRRHFRIAPRMRAARERGGDAAPGRGRCVAAHARGRPARAGERLGVFDGAPDDGAEEDPRFGVYEWLGYRLDGLVAVVDDPRP